WRCWRPSAASPGGRWSTGRTRSGSGPTTGTWSRTTRSFGRPVGVPATTWSADSARSSPRRDSSLDDRGPRPVVAPEPSVGRRYRALKRAFLDTSVSCLSDQEVAAAVDEAIRTRSRLVISFLNPDYALRAARDPDLAAKINAFDVVLAD